MRVKSLQFLRIRVPLSRAVRHAAQVRSENDAVFVRCQTEAGCVGWGEGLPRDYVTGERMEDLWGSLQQWDARNWLGSVSFGSLDELRALLDRWDFPTIPGNRDSYGNSVRCAVELAILDAWSQECQQPLWVTIQQLAPPDIVQSEIPTALSYTAVLTSASDTKLMLLALAARIYGFQQVKLKVGGDAAAECLLVKRVRRGLGRQLRLRVDANGAWSADELHSRLAALRTMDVSCVEQPLLDKDVDALNGVRGQAAVPIMLDESLCSVADAIAAIEHERCDAFNVRLSKCGGVFSSLEIVRLAAEAGVAVQLGCMVGETGILSAAGRHFATAVRGLTALEGSNDRFLFRTRLTREDLTWGYGGRAPVLRQWGLGVRVQEAILKRWQLSSIEIL